MTNSYHPPLPTAMEIAQRLGLHRAGRGWRGGCPCCGYPDAFALDVREGRIVGWCASCQDRAALAAALRAAAGGALPSSDRPARIPRLDRADAAARVARAAAIWDGASPIEPGSPAALYLERRRIAHVASSPALRWRGDTPHPSGGRHLALIAAITGADGDFSGVQRIYLDRDGRKAACEPTKASLGQVAGGACRLQECSEEMVVAEGVETAAAAAALLGKPAWSAVSCGNLGKSLALPPGIRTIVIAADHDPAGLRAAEAAWRRWRAEGRSVRIVKPNHENCDFNDLQRDAARGIER